MRALPRKLKSPRLRSQHYFRAEKEIRAVHAELTSDSFLYASVEHLLSESWFRFPPTEFPIFVTHANKFSVTFTTIRRTPLSHEHGINCHVVFLQILQSRKCPTTATRLNNKFRFLFFPRAEGDNS